MADDTDVLLRLCEHEWTQGKQSEDQRATITNIVLLIASAVVGLIAQIGLNARSYPLAFLLCVLGTFGAVAAEKLYERHQFHFGRARAYRGYVMRELHPSIQFDAVMEQARAEHSAAFSRMGKLHLHHVWLALHIGILLAGVTLTAMILTK